MSEPMHPRECPLCAEPNGCELAEGKSKCWCFYAEFDPRMREAMARLPGKPACLCASCGAGKMSPARRKKLMEALIRGR